MKESLKIYGDGSSSGKSDEPIGWAYFVVYKGIILLEGSGGALKGSNNIAELGALIEGIKAAEAHDLIKSHIPTLIVSDSMYALNLATGQYRAKANYDLAIELKELCKRLSIGAKWVRGHSFDKKLPKEDQDPDSYFNFKCDRAANAYKLKMQELAKGESNVG